MNDEQLRQVAIFIDSMDRHMADHLLEQLPDEKQREIRGAVLDLSDVTPEEATSVSKIFYGRLSGCKQDAPRLPSLDPTDALTGVLADATAGLSGRGNTEGSPADEILEPSIQEVTNAESSGRLHDGARNPCMERLEGVVQSVSVETLWLLVRDEHPQTIALIASALLADRAAEFIGRLPTRQQPDVLRRIAELGEADDDALVEVQSELSRQISARLAGFPNSDGESQGVHRLRTIVAAADQTVRSELLRGLAHADSRLAESLQLPSEAPASKPQLIDSHALAVAFDRLADFDSEQLNEVVSNIGIDVAAIAFAGASQTCLRDVLELLPGELAAALKKEIQTMGPLRLSDIQQAQLMVVEEGRRLTTGSGDTDHRLKLSA